MWKMAVIPLIFVAAFGPAFASRAAELYINSDGRVRVSDAEITYLNNNIITVTLWGTRWIFFVDVADSDVKLTNAAGEPIDVWKLAAGHKLYVEGFMRDAGVGKIEVNVKLLRDMSIPGSGKAIASSNLGAAAAAFGSLNSAPPAATPSPAAEVQKEVQKPVAVSARAVSAAEQTGRALRRGMSGRDVRELQEALLYKRYLMADEVTGFFGEATERAVKKLQKANGLPQNGSVDKLTAELVRSIRAEMPLSSVAMKSTPPAPSSLSSAGASRPLLTKDLHLGMSGEEVKILQEFLQKNNLGIPDDGPVTGFYGKLTAEAVARFQKANGLEAVGYVGPRTRQLINKLLSQ